MRNHRPRFDEHIEKALAGRGALSFNELMAASHAPNSQTFSRNLRRMCRDGRVEREVQPTFPPRTLYRLIDQREAE